MLSYLQFIRIHSRAFGIALIFSIFVASLSFFIYISLKEWKKQVVQTNMVLCDVRLIPINRKIIITTNM